MNSYKLENFDNLANSLSDDIKRLAERHMRERIVAAIGEDGLSRVTITATGSDATGFSYEISGPPHLARKVRKMLSSN